MWGSIGNGRQGRCETFRITPEVLAEAEAAASKIPSEIRNSIMGGDGILAGCVGEVGACASAGRAGAKVGSAGTGST